MTAGELVHQGFLSADTTGKHGYKLTVTEAGKQALEAIRE
jgi:predicted transcriptional regulator